jgi:glycosyltransferase involved in cell wall biosynthesis
VRVLHVIPSLDPGEGGPSKAVIEICRALQQADVEVEIASTGEGPAPENIPAHLFPRKGNLDYKYSPALARWLDTNVKRYDVLHVHAVFNHSTHAACRAAMRLGVPYIVRPLGTLNESYSLQQSAWKKRQYLRWIGRTELDSAMALHCTSQPEAEDLRRLGLRPPKVVIPHGLRTEEFEQLPPRGAFRHGETPIILFFGRVHPKKGFDVLLPALEMLSKRHDFHLLIAGPGDEAYIAGLKAEAQRRGIASRVTFAGMLTGAARLRPLADADIFVLPSYNENFGIAVAEAMACSIPVVVSDQVDLCVEVHDWRAGLVVTCDVGELSTGLARMLSDPAFRAECGANGKRQVTANMRWDRVAARLRHLYESARKGRVEG